MIIFLFGLNRLKTYKYTDVKEHECVHTETYLHVIHYFG